MKKFLVCIILSFACICSAKAVNDTIKVATIPELHDAIFNHGTESNTVIKLMADLDMADYEPLSYEFGWFVGYLEEFHATIDGYYTMKDSLGNELKEPDGKVKQYLHTIVNADAPLLADVRDATIKGIRFRHSENGGHTNDTPSLVCYDAYNTTFQGIIIEDCHYDDKFFFPRINSNYGFISTTMDHCYVNGIQIINSSITIKGTVVGGITGFCDWTNFDDCFTDHFCDFFAEAGFNAYIGGFVGSSQNSKFSHCINMANVSASEKADNVGGFCGLSTEDVFLYCTNSGTLSQVQRTVWGNYMLVKGQRVRDLAEKPGDVVLSYQESAFVHREFQLATDRLINMEGQEGFSEYFDTWVEKGLDVERYGQSQKMSTLMSVMYLIYQIYNEVYEAQEPDEMGGIAAAAYGSHFYACQNAGIIHCLDAYAGGIVGYAGNSSYGPTWIEHCYNRAYVQGNEQTGGIVGYMGDKTCVEYCLNTGTVDCVEATQGPIYGEKGGSASAANCFAMQHEAEYTPGVEGGEEVYYVNVLDVRSGMVACELNRLGDKVFCQNVGTDFYPRIGGYYGESWVNEKRVNYDVEVEYRVKNFPEFVDAMFDQYADIILENDIDFEKTHFMMYSRFTPFHGSIDGQNHCLKNIFVSDYSESGDGYTNSWDRILQNYTDFAMIGGAQQAVFKNLRLENVSVKFPTRVSGFVGDSKDCVYDHVSLASALVTANWNGVGGLVRLSDHDIFSHCGLDENCKVSTVNLNGFKDDALAGGLVSQAKGSRFNFCYNDGEVAARTNVAGGIVAKCDEYCYLQDCINRGYVHHSSEHIEDNDYLGGIAGYAEKSDFLSCVNTGLLTCEDEYGGGILGRGVEVTLNNCLNATPKLLFDNSTCGGIIGEAKYCLITNCCSNADLPLIGNTSVFGNDDKSGNNFRVKDTNPDESKYELTVTRQEMRSGLVAKYLNDYNTGGDSPWRQNLTSHDGMLVDDCPSLDPTHDLVTVENRTRGTAISTPKELIAFAKRVNEGEKDQFASAHLTRDIDMDGYDWTPIGSNNSFSQYRGAFDGRGHTIKNLKVNTCAAAGLFGVAHMGAEICNLIIGEGSEINSTSDEGAAGILGQVKIGWNWGYVRIQNCGSYASVKGTKHAAGIFGRYVPVNGNDDVRVYIDRCFNMGTITASQGNSGLLCGYMRNSGVVSNCWSGGKLKTSTSQYPFDANQRSEQELLVGYDEKCDITNCYTIDAVTNVDQWQSYYHQEGVTDLNNSVLASGELTYILNGMNNDPEQSHYWQQNLGTDLVPAFGDRGFFHERYLIKKDYGTICVPYTLKSTPDAGAHELIEYYTFKEVKTEDGEVSLCFEYADEVPPGTPALYHLYLNGNYSFPEAEPGYSFQPQTVAYSDWAMVGTLQTKVFEGDAAKTIYYVSNDANQNGVIMNAKKVTIAPTRAYFVGPSIDELLGNNGEPNAARISILIDGVESGLHLVVDDPDRSNAKAYTLFGTEAGEDYHGIVVRGGQKMLVR